MFAVAYCQCHLINVLNWKIKNKLVFNSVKAFVIKIKRIVIAYINITQLNNEMHFLRFAGGTIGKIDDSPVDCRLTWRINMAY